MTTHLFRPMDRRAGITGCCGRTLQELPDTDMAAMLSHQVDCNPDHGGDTGLGAEWEALQHKQDVSA